MPNTLWRRETVGSVLPPCTAFVRSGAVSHSCVPKVSLQWQEAVLICTVPSCILIIGKEPWGLGGFGFLTWDLNLLPTIFLSYGLCHGALGRLALPEINTVHSHSPNSQRYIYIFFPPPKFHQRKSFPQSVFTRLEVKTRFTKIQQNAQEIKFPW